MDAGRLGIIPKGAYDSSAQYEFLDSVFFSDDGCSYVAIADTIGHAPGDETYWKKMTDSAGNISAETAAEKASEASASATAASTSEENAKASEEAAAISAEQAKQVATNNGYYYFTISESGDTTGHLIESRTENVSDLTFAITDDGNLEVTYA